MERKIGGIFEHNGDWYQVVECSEDNYPCIGCCGCKGVGGARINGGECNGNARNDRKFVIFKKLEKVGEPYEHYGKLYQCYKLLVEIEIRLLPDNCYPVGKDNLVEIQIKQNKENNMEEKELTYEELLHYYHSTVGLWAIDRNPQEVHFDWVCKNTFQLGTDKTLSNLFKIGKNLKPFDLEAAKAGKPVCTRDGRSVRIICFNRESIGFPIIALIKNGDTEGVYQFDNKGRSNIDDEERGYDLMMLPEKKEGWVNIYALNTCYSSKEEAEANIDKDYEHEYVRTVKINWEE